MLTLTEVFWFLATLLAVVSAADYLEEWESWKREFGKHYDSVELEQNHFTNWLRNYKYVMDHNANRAHSAGFTTGLNAYSDIDPVELMRRRGNTHLSKGLFPATKTFKPSVSVEDVPDTVDWREKGYVTSVKDQKLCASCWAFAAAGALEAQHVNATGRLVELSAQQLVDCVPYGEVYGCAGGESYFAFDYIIKQGGLDTEASYPYTAEYETGFCKFKKASVGATMSSYVNITSKSEDDLKIAVATIGPIAVSIATEYDFTVYKSGVYFNANCSTTELDHAMLVVGYGTTSDGQDYWLLKNTWGTSWGYGGYGMLSRNHGNACGVATRPNYPLV